MKSSRVEAYLDVVTGQIKNVEARFCVKKELASHIQEIVTQGKCYGLSEDAALEDALKRMGNPIEIGHSLNQTHVFSIDYFSIVLSLSLAVAGFIGLSSIGWLNLQMMWALIGLACCALILKASYKVLNVTLAALYPLAVLGIILTYAFGAEYEHQSYLNLGLIKIKMFDLAAVMIITSLASLSNLFPSKFRFWAIASLVCPPIFYFSAMGSLFQALVVWLGGIVVATMYGDKIKLPVFLTGALVTVIPAAGNQFLDASRLANAMKAEAHTDFILTQLFSISHIVALVTILVLFIFCYRLLTAGFEIKNKMLSATSTSIMSVMVLSSIWGIATNLGFAPALASGVNIPFLSYGGSLLVFNLFSVGVVLACLKRKAISVFV